MKVHEIEFPNIAGEMRKFDLYGTSIERYGYGYLSEEEALELLIVIWT